MTRRNWFILLAVVFVAIPGWIVAKSSHVLSTAAINPAAPFPAEHMPEAYRSLNAIKGDNGQLFEYYLPDQFTKISFIVATQLPVHELNANEQSDAVARASLSTASINALPTSGEGIVKVLVRRQNERFIDQPALAPFTQRYLGSAFDPQRAYEFAPVTFDSQQLAALPAARFITTRAANYIVTAWRRNGTEFSILAMKKEVPVDATVVEKFVEELRAEYQPEVRP